ncbi:nuclear transport factor 2 family protein [Nocardia sp. 004]|uniref:nuclear transport factor 2 family protein n=1 Tax=Nocardia sp. 004 TaxID=3385978 RepID=UPI0039A14E16
MTATPATTTVTAGRLVEMLEALYNRDDPSLLRALAAAHLRHYSSGIGDGVDAWVAYAAAFAGTSPLIAVHRTVSAGNRIGIHAHYRWNVDRVIDGGPGVAVAHIFTIESGRIVEAVEVTQAVTIESVSGNDMFTQLHPSVDRQDQEHNQQIARRVVTEFLAGDTSLRDELLSDYTQHNPFIPNGAEGIAGFIDMLGGNPNDYQWAIAEGDLAWTYTRYLSTTMGTPPLVGVDIWRFDAAGKITEHWDVLESDFTSPDGRTFPG